MSRFDAVGLYWEDWEDVEAQRVPGGARMERMRTMPPIPDTGWTPPAEFPNLSCAEVISIDVETYDPNLLDKGPGGFRKDGHIVGLAIGADHDGRWYFPLRHSVGGGNLDPETVLRWAGDVLSQPGQPKVGANLLYDLEWLAAEGVEVAGPFYDVQIAEPLLDENAFSYSLETLAQKYLAQGKTSSLLYQWCADAYGGEPNGKQRANIHRAPAALVGPYAEGDVDLPLRVLALQRKAMEAAGLNDLFSLESRLLPILLAMRRRGVRIDLERAVSVSADLSHRLQQIRAQWPGLDPWASESIARLCDKEGIGYPRTARTGVPSFRAEWLEEQTHPLVRAVLTARKLDKANGTFIKGYVLGKHVNGRIHAQFNALKSDDSGAVSGRFSSSNPNLQNIPARDDELRPLIRGLFLPEDGEEWVRLDYSQIEPRIQFHYSKGAAAERARQQLRDNPALNCYRVMMEPMGWEQDRYKAFKAIWLGVSYGMGLPKLAAQLGVTQQLAKVWLAQFPPYIMDLAGAVRTAAQNRGHIRTLLGRYARFPRWESRDFKTAEKDGTFTEAAAREKYGAQVKRAWTHSAPNRLAQGSAADVMKKAMVDIWDAGVCNVLGAPLLTVHDELDFSVPRTAAGQEAVAEAKRIMETCVQLRVPLRAEEERGPDWGHVE